MVDPRAAGGRVPRSGALLCPNCRKLISADESQCPYCGLSTPGSRWKQALMARGDFSEARLIQAVIATNVVMFIISLLLSRGGIGISGNPLLLLSPDSRGLLLLGATGTYPIDHFHRWWTLVAASYLHGGILHIGFNMAAFWQIAPLVIREYGVHRMFSIYTLAGVGGFLVSYLAGVSQTIGASAAICGLIGTLLYYGKRRGGNYGQAVYRQVGGWAISIAIFGIVIPGINNWAHGGGMAAGILLGLMMGYQERRKETIVDRLLGHLCLLATAAVLGWALFSALF
jgi:rhomboid protease GluP